MNFLAKTVSSTVLGMVGSWVGGFMGMGASLLIGFIFSIAGWYGAKYLLNKYLD